MDTARLVVALGPGDPDLLPVGAIRILRAEGRCRVIAEPALAGVIASLGVEIDPAADVVAAPDRIAWRLAQHQPDALTWPGRDRLGPLAAAGALAELQAVTARLRRDCPWDREQTAATIVPHTLEEAYEVAEKALAGPPDEGLVDELGDLLFQTYFLALLAEEAGVGDLESVADGITAKLVRRHPHVFGSEEIADADGVRGRWESIKREQEGRVGIFHDVPGSLPGLLHARKLQRRAAAVGFDWTRWQDAWPSLVEEVAELREALDEAPPAAEPSAPVRHEAGDLLFAAVNVLRLAGVDPELALRDAGRRFRERVEGAERLAAAAGEEFAVLGLEEQDGYYRAAKAAGSGASGGTPGTP